MAIAPSVLWLCVASLAVGCSTSNVHVIVPLAAHLAPPNERGRVVGTVLGGLLVGVLLARTFSGVVGARYGWRTVYWIGAAVMIVLAAVIRQALPVSRPDESPRWPDLMRSIVGLVREHAVVREAAFLAFLMYSSFTALWTTLVFLLRTPPYTFGTAAAGAFGLLGAASASAAPLVGRFADRYSAERAVLMAIVTSLVAFVILLVGGRMLPGLIAGIILIDIGVQSGHVANQSRIYSLVPSARGRLNTFYMMAFMTGGAVGSYLGPLGFKLWGWAGFCAYPIAALTIALTYVMRGNRAALTARATPAA
jgi:predicted MFS family arabinose efflux permease